MEMNKNKLFHKSMNNKKFINSFIQVGFSNGLNLISNVLVGIVLPLALSVSSYGYFRLFSLYLTYIGVMHFGFIDGIYLKYAGNEYDQLEKNKFRFFTKFLFMIEVTLTVIISIVALVVIPNENKIIFLLLAANLISLIMTTYYQFISQITKRFKEYSTLNILRSFITSITVIIFLVFKIDNYILYISILIAFSYIFLAWYIYTYREITFGKSISFFKISAELKSVFIIGIPLLFSNLITVGILNMSKQYVDWHFPIESFAIFSYAFSIMGIANVFLNSMGTVLFPTLKNINSDKLSKVYNKSIILVIIFTSLVMNMFFPLKIIVDSILPNYAYSIEILFIIFPSFILSSIILIIKFNFFKALNEVKTFLITGFLILVTSILIYEIALYINYSLYSLTFSYVTVVFFWSLLTDVFFAKKYKVKSIKQNLFFLSITISFYTSYIFGDKVFISFIWYLVLNFTMILMFYYKDIKILIKTKKIY